MRKILLRLLKRPPPVVVEGAGVAEVVEVVEATRSRWRFRSRRSKIFSL